MRTVSSAFWLASSGFLVFVVVLGSFFGVGGGGERWVTAAFSVLYKESKPRGVNTSVPGMVAI